MSITNSIGNSNAIFVGRDNLIALGNTGPTQFYDGKVPVYIGIPGKEWLGQSALFHNAFDYFFAHTAFGDYPLHTKERGTAEARTREWILEGHSLSGLYDRRVGPGDNDPQLAFARHQMLAARKHAAEINSTQGHEHVNSLQQVLHDFDSGGSTGTDLVNAIGDAKRALSKPGALATDEATYLQDFIGQAEAKLVQAAAPGRDSVAKLGAAISNFDKNPGSGKARDRLNKTLFDTEHASRSDWADADVKQAGVWQAQARKRLYPPSAKAVQSGTVGTPLSGTLVTSTGVWVGAKSASGELRQGVLVRINGSQWGLRGKDGATPYKVPMSIQDRDAAISYAKTKISGNGWTVLESMSPTMVKGSSGHDQAAYVKSVRDQVEKDIASIHRDELDWGNIAQSKSLFNALGDLFFGDGFKLYDNTRAQLNDIVMDAGKGAINREQAMRRKSVVMADYSAAHAAQISQFGTNAEAGAAMAGGAQTASNFVVTKAGTALGGPGLGAAAGFANRTLQDTFANWVTNALPYDKGVASYVPDPGDPKRMAHNALASLADAAFLNGASVITAGTAAKLAPVLPASLLAPAAAGLGLGGADLLRLPLDLLDLVVGQQFDQSTLRQAIDSAKTQYPKQKAEYLAGSAAAWEQARPDWLEKTMRSQAVRFETYKQQKLKEELTLRNGQLNTAMANAEHRLEGKPKAERAALLAALREGLSQRRNELVAQRAAALEAQRQPFLAQARAQANQFFSAKRDHDLGQRGAQLDARQKASITASEARLHKLHSAAPGEVLREAKEKFVNIPVTALTGAGFGAIENPLTQTGKYSFQLKPVPAAITTGIGGLSGAAGSGVQSAFSRGDLPTDTELTNAFLSGAITALPLADAMHGPDKSEPTRAVGTGAARAINPPDLSVPPSTPEPPASRFEAPQPRGVQPPKSTGSPPSELKADLPIQGAKPVPQSFVAGQTPMADPPPLALQGRGAPKTPAANPGPDTLGGLPPADRGPLTAEVSSASQLPGLPFERLNPSDLSFSIDGAVTRFNLFKDDMLGAIERKKQGLYDAGTAVYSTNIEGPIINLGRATRAKVQPGIDAAGLFIQERILLPSARVLEEKVLAPVVESALGQQLLSSIDSAAQSFKSGAFDAKLRAIDFSHSDAGQVLGDLASISRKAGLGAKDAVLSGVGAASDRLQKSLPGVAAATLFVLAQANVQGKTRMVSVHGDKPVVGEALMVKKALNISTGIDFTYMIADFPGMEKLGGRAIVAFGAGDHAVIGPATGPGQSGVAPPWFGRRADRSFLITATGVAYGPNAFFGYSLGTTNLNISDAYSCQLGRADINPLKMEAGGVPRKSGRNWEVSLGAPSLDLATCAHFSVLNAGPAAMMFTRFRDPLSPKTAGVLNTENKYLVLTPRVGADGQTTYVPFLDITKKARVSDISPVVPLTGATTWDPKAKDWVAADKLFKRLDGFMRGLPTGPAPTVPNEPFAPLSPNVPVPTRRNDGDPPAGGAGAGDPPSSSGGGGEVSLRSPPSAGSGPSQGSETTLEADIAAASGVPSSGFKTLSLFKDSATGFPNRLGRELLMTFVDPATGERRQMMKSDLGVPEAKAALAKWGITEPRVLDDGRVMTVDMKRLRELLANAAIAPGDAMSVQVTTELAQPERAGPPYTLGELWLATSWTQREFAVWHAPKSAQWNVVMGTERLKGDRWLTEFPSGVNLVVHFHPTNSPPSGSDIRAAQTGGIGGRNSLVITAAPEQKIDDVAVYVFGDVPGNVNHPGTRVTGPPSDTPDPTKSVVSSGEPGAEPSNPALQARIARQATLMSPAGEPLAALPIGYQPGAPFALALEESTGLPSRVWLPQQPAGVDAEGFKMLVSEAAAVPRATPSRSLLLLTAQLDAQGQLQVARRDGASISHTQAQAIADATVRPVQTEAIIGAVLPRSWIAKIDAINYAPTDIRGARRAWSETVLRRFVKEFGAQATPQILDAVAQRRRFPGDSLTTARVNQFMQVMLPFADSKARSQALDQLTANAGLLPGQAETDLLRSYLHNVVTQGWSEERWVQAMWFIHGENFSVIQARLFEKLNERLKLKSYASVLDYYGQLVLSGK